MYLASWSGGKDSCFACYRAIQAGYQISHLVNFISQEYKRVSFHGTEARLIQLQGKLIGIPVVQKETGPDDYEPAFKSTVQSLLGLKPNTRKPGCHALAWEQPQSEIHNLQSAIRGMVFGDIYLQEHKQWVERVCSELGIKAYLPLWGMRTEDILDEFIRSGFEAIVISAKASLIEQEWIGHKVDNDFIDYLKTKPLIDLCGEMGEYHTVVINGPFFKNRIEIKQSEAIEKETPYGKWRFLDIQEYATCQPVAVT